MPESRSTAAAIRWVLLVGALVAWAGCGPVSLLPPLEPPPPSAAAPVLPAETRPSPPPVRDPDGSDADWGRRLHLAWCARCHGPEGRGDGPAAAVQLHPPADLTGIAYRRGGVFSDTDVAGHIDGRFPHPAHGPPERPVWGVSLLAGGEDGDAPSGLELRALVVYLESIQR